MPSSGIMAVGDIKGALPDLDPEFRALMRVTVSTGAGIEGKIRAVLNKHPAIEVIEDPLGIIHEAVPYEAMILIGSEQTAISLDHSLRRHFKPLAFRTLDFDVRHVQAPEPTRLLFGDLLFPGLNRPKGVVRITYGGVTIEPIMPDAAGGHFTALMAQQSVMVIALGKGEASIGLPLVDVGKPEQAIIIKATPQGPSAELKTLLSPSPEADKVDAVFDLTIEQAVVTHDTAAESFQAHFDKSGLSVEIIPNTEFSRFLTERAEHADMLEIVGVVIPLPKRRRSVLGFAVRLDVTRRLLAHGMRQEVSRAVATAYGEKFIRFSNARLVKADRRGNFADIGARFVKGQSLSSDAPSKMLGFRADDSSHLGYIPLIVSQLIADDPFRGQRCRVSFQSSERIDDDDRSEKGVAIYLDWLDHAVQLIVDDQAGGSRKVGLATWWIQHFGPKSREFQLKNKQIIYTVDDKRSKVLRDRTTFRMGPLVVRYLKRAT